MLIPKHAYQQADNNKGINVFDITGIYNASSKPGGYGAPNAAVGDFATCVATWYLPDATTKLPSTTIGATVDMFPTLPTTTTTPFLTTSTALLGSDQVLANGIYRVVVEQETTVDPPVEYSSDTRFVVIGQVKCCIDSLVLAADSCTCKGKDNNKLTWAQTQLDQLFVLDRSTGLISDGETCNFWNKMAEIIINSEAICASRNCDSCQSAKCC